MKIECAKECLEENRKENGQLDESGLAELIIWAYDQGYEDATEDYRENKNPTEEMEYIKSR